MQFKDLKTYSSYLIIADITFYKNVHGSDKNFHNFYHTWMQRNFFLGR